MASKTVLVTAFWTVGLAIAGCAGEHGLVVGTSADLACEPSELRSVWWSDDGGPFYGGTNEILLSPDGTQLLVEDLFRSTAIRLSDGARSDGIRLTVDLTEAAGIRFASQRMVTDADGRSDYAGTTDVLAIGTPTPLAGIPWLVPRDATGSTQVVAHVSQTNDRVYLIERASAFDGTERGIWLRSIRVSSPSDEIRLDLARALASTAMTWQEPFTILVDEPRNVVFIAIGRQVSVPPSITRIELTSGAVHTQTLALDPDAPLLGLAHVGEPGTQLLEIALAHDASEIYLTTRDGRLRVLDADTLTEARPGTSVGVVVANADTYLPSVRSPVASSAHDGLLALLDDAGRVVIADASSMARLTTLSSSAPLVHDIDLAMERGPRPIALRFLADGLVVITDTGIERYRCPE